MSTSQSSRTTKLQGDITRWVMWGETDEHIFDELSGHSHDPNEVSALIKEARLERVKTIRSVYWPKMIWAILFIMIGLFLFWKTWGSLDNYDYNKYRKRVMVGFLVIVFFGVAKLTTALNGILNAGSRRGSIADIE